MINLEQLPQSALATAANHCLSTKYKFIPTTRVLEQLDAAGWSVKKARQTVVRNPERSAFAKHLIELQPNGAPIVVGDTNLQLLLVNSHDGTSSFELMLGLFRLVCSNGLMVSKGNFASARIRHIGYADAHIGQALQGLLQKSDALHTAVEGMRSRTINLESKIQFAHRASLIRYGATENMPQGFEASALLTVRRDEDAGDSAWQVFNRVQENLIRGGLSTRTNLRRGTTRAIKAIDETIRVNTELWQAAEALR